MPDLVKIATWEAVGLLTALSVLVMLRLLTGDLRTRGLIEGTTAAGSRFVSAGRVQLLIATLVVAVQYASQAWQSPQRLPDVPQTWLLLLGGSHVLYLGSKFHGKRNRRFHV
jgi:hypothetical protein